MRSAYYYYYHIILWYGLFGRIRRSRRSMYAHHAPTAIYSSSDACDIVTYDASPKINAIVIAFSVGPVCRFGGEHMILISEVITTRRYVDGVARSPTTNDVR